MDAFDLPLGVVILAAAVAVGLPLARAIRARRRARQRVVERPNSHYTSVPVRQVETRHRWHDIPLDRIHEINREEVVRLLARVDATSVDSLSPREREFLDHLADVTLPRRKAERPAPEPPLTPELRHRPA